MVLPFWVPIDFDKTFAPWHLSKLEASFQARTNLLYFQEEELISSFLRDIKLAELSDMRDLSLAGTKAATRIQSQRGRVHKFINEDVPVCKHIHAFTIGIFVLMDELGRIQIERIHARRYGIPWDISQDCDYVKHRCPVLPEFKYFDRTLMLVTWPQYFSAANGLPSALPH
eukprot:13063212-Heterocapsa_arctica.AAC.1